MSKKVCIHVKNKTEKMAALFLLSKAYNLRIDDIYDNGIMDMDYPYIKTTGTTISADCERPSNMIVIEFNENLTCESIRNYSRTVKLNDEYVAEVSKGYVKVGCQTFPIEKIQEILDVHSKLS